MLKDARPQATRDGGHTVLIFGCNEDEAATEFPYVDPYAGGSTIKYKGGIATDSYPSKCFFLGLFKVELPMRGPSAALAPRLRRGMERSRSWQGVIRYGRSRLARGLFKPHKRRLFRRQSLS